MSDDGKCYAATPAATLEEHILNSNIAKSDTEWWAHHEITRLRADLAAVTAERDRMREALKPFADRHKDLHSGYDDGIAARDYPTVFVFVQDLRRARAALDGVTEKAGAVNE